MLIWAKRTLECYELSIMDHGSGGFEDQKPKRNASNSGLAQGVSEGSQGLIRVCARVYYGYRQAKDLADSSHYLRTCRILKSRLVD